VGIFHYGRVGKFLQMIDDCSLIDLGATSYKYTWYRRQANGRVAK